MVSGPPAGPTKEFTPLSCWSVNIRGGARCWDQQRSGATCFLLEMFLSSTAFLLIGLDSYVIFTEFCFLQVVVTMKSIYPNGLRLFLEELNRSVKRGKEGWGRSSKEEWKGGEMRDAEERMENT